MALSLLVVGKYTLRSTEMGARGAELGVWWWDQACWKELFKSYSMVPGMGGNWVGHTLGVAMCCCRKGRLEAKEVGWGA